MGDKISAIKNFPNIKASRKFGLFSGCVAIIGFSYAVLPELRRLTFHWNAPQDKIFNDLKSA